MVFILARLAPRLGRILAAQSYACAPQPACFVACHHRLQPLGILLAGTDLIPWGLSNATDSIPWGILRIESSADVRYEEWFFFR
ncbi:MAG TPA: hypothetical protein VE954_08245 [Oligoflexus sp.]|uniref:hypothetical protein n=1 Tax=Oligoflexus sp. TaxID=1971216 RepID=UPI002D2FA23F|nr:hypothetical protein [Oligoflexus sp.]HYX33093.1 hypothetical protein [Oligoflexus sp.]